MVRQEVHNNSSSQASPSISNMPFGSTFSHSAVPSSPALSQSSVPSHATNGHHQWPTLGHGPGDSTAARPSGLNRIDSGFTEPGTDLTYIPSHWNPWSTVMASSPRIPGINMHDPTMYTLCIMIVAHAECGCGLRKKMLRQCGACPSS